MQRWSSYGRIICICDFRVKCDIRRVICSYRAGGYHAITNNVVHTFINIIDHKDSTDYEYVDGPAHYHGTECIEKMRKLYGDDAVRWFCICNAYKYRFRNGSKPGVTAEQDEEKARWYESYAANMMGEQRYY